MNPLSFASSFHFHYYRSFFDISFTVNHHAILIFSNLVFTVAVLILQYVSGVRPGLSSRSFLTRGSHVPVDQ
jgi:hypothetical protein